MRCGASWARVLIGLGHDVKLIAPEAVRPFVKKGKKNDAADAAALCEAASRPDMRFVPVKSLEQQGTLALHSTRSLLVKQQTMLANAMRGLATEFGLTVPKGIGRLVELMALVDANEAFPEKARRRSRGCSSMPRAGRDHRGARSEDRRPRAARRDGPPSGDDPRHRSDHRVADSGNGCRHQGVQERTTFRCLARPGAAAALYRREDPARPDHQIGQPGDPQVVGPGGDLDGLPGRRGTAPPGLDPGLLERRPSGW